jgi:hypothetical protein
VPVDGREYSHESRPSANMFFARSFSLLVSVEVGERLDGDAT